MKTTINYKALYEKCERDSGELALQLESERKTNKRLRMALVSATAASAALAEEVACGHERNLGQQGDRSCRPSGLSERRRGVV